MNSFSKDVYFCQLKTDDLYVAYSPVLGEGIKSFELINGSALDACALAMIVKSWVVISALTPIHI